MLACNLPAVLRTLGLGSAWDEQAHEAVRFALSGHVARWAWAWELTGSVTEGEGRVTR